MDSQTVVVGYVHGPYVNQAFMHSLFAMWVRDAWQSHLILDFVPEYSGPNICKCRNEMVNKFLANDRAEWLLILDSDAVFKPTLLEELHASADPVERPIVGGLAHQYRARRDAAGNPCFDERGVVIREVMPTMYQGEWDANGDWVGYREVTRYTIGLNRVDATGCHCLLVHRSVFEAIKSEHPYRWFREEELRPGVIAGEDITFCLAARDVGMPVFVNTAVEVGHEKLTVLTSADSHIERIV